MNYDNGGRSRRRFLRGAALGSTALLTGLSGCSSVGDSKQMNLEDVPAEKFPSITIPKKERESLKKTGEIKRANKISIFGAGVSAYTSGKIFELADVTESVKKETMGELSQPLAVFFGAEINLEGLGTGQANSERLAENAKGQVKTQLQQQGAKNLREVSPQDPLPDVSNSHSFEYRATYRTEGFTQTAPVGEEKTIQIDVPAQNIEIAGLVTAWKPNKGKAYLAGGGYPFTDFEAHPRDTVTSSEGDGIDFQVHINLGLDEMGLRSRLNSLAESIE